MPDIVGGYHILRGADRVDSSVVEHYDVVGIPGREVQIVAYHDDNYALFLGEPLQQTDDIHLVMYVQIGRGLIQQKNLRLLGYPAGEHDALMLACGQLVEVPHRQVRDIHHTHGLLHDYHVIVQGLPLVMGVAAHQHGIDHGHRERVPRGARDVSDLLGQIPGLVALHILAVNQNRPLHR